jgi:hypothetical protein
MALLVRAFPLKASRPELTRFIQELQGARKQEAAAFYRDHGVTHESWYLQQTEHGPWVIGLTQVQDVAESAPRFQQATEDFAGWFKQQILALSGVDPSVQPLGPPTEPVYEFSATPETARNFAPPSL